MEDVFQASNEENNFTLDWAASAIEEIEEPLAKDNFDLRHKIFRRSSDGGGSAEDISQSPSHRPRLGGHDLRLKLSRNRPDQMDRSWSRGRRRHDGSEKERKRRGEPGGRPKYTERAGGLSPLRSPRATTLHNILDLDNSRNHRFTNHLQGGSSASPGQGSHGKIRRFNETTPGSDDVDVLSPAMTTTVLSDCDDTEENSKNTPEYSRKSGRLDRTSWTRRRLELPSETIGQEEDEESRLPTISEEPTKEEASTNIPKPQWKELDQARMARREKDIAYGKNTDAYKLYTELIPRELRSKNTKKHPRTPRKYKECSRRSWDAQVKLWKRRIHAWANEECANQETEEPVMTEHNSGSGTSWANIVAGRHSPGDATSACSGVMDKACSDGGMADSDDEIDLERAALSEDEEDIEAFLDFADIDFAVADQIHEHVRLDDA